MLAITIILSFIFTVSAYANHNFRMGNQHGELVDTGLKTGYFHIYKNHCLSQFECREIQIFVPRAVSNSTAKFSVIYANDGNKIFAHSSENHLSWNLGIVVDELIHQQNIPPILIVAITPNERLREYSHIAMPNNPEADLEMYSNYVANTLKTWVDKHYPTDKGTAANMLLGSSRGGLAAFYTATKNPSVFGQVIAMSPSFWYGIDAPGSRSDAVLADSALLDTLDPFLSKHPFFLQTIYLDWGLVRTGGFHNEWIEERSTYRTKEMIELLRDRYGLTTGKHLYYVEDPKGEHDERSWNRRIKTLLPQLEWVKGTI